MSPSTGPEVIFPIRKIQKRLKAVEQGMKSAVAAPDQAITA
jgi:hypothetical protein